LKITSALQKNQRIRVLSRPESCHGTASGAPGTPCSGRIAPITALISRISRNLAPSVFERREEKKGHHDNGERPSDIPRKIHRFIIAEEDEGEFIMLQLVPLIEFPIDGICYRNSGISGNHPPRIRFQRLLITHQDASSHGQSPYSEGFPPRHHPFCLGKKTGLPKGYEKE